MKPQVVRSRDLAARAQALYDDPSILALDLSLTATGWATSLDNYGTETRPGKLRGVERLAAWQHWLVTLKGPPPFDLALIEGYAFGRANKATAIGEWGGVARLTLHQGGVPFVEIPPATIKKFATGKGNAPKPDMRMALYKRGGIDVADDNTVDALWLLAAAHQHYATPLFDMPKANVEALGKVGWPELSIKETT